MTSRFCVFVLAVLCFAGGSPAMAQISFGIYSDSLLNGFEDWSWGVRSFTNSSPVHSGAMSISDAGGAWNGLSFWHSDFNPSPCTALTFWADGGATGGQILNVYCNFGTNSGPGYALSPLPQNAWQFYSVPLSALGLTGVTNLNRINLQLTPSGTTNGYYIDDIALTGSQVSVTVDASKVLRPADGRWFGLNTAIWDSDLDTTTTSNLLNELDTRLLRFPGGSTSDQYHWATDTTLTNTWKWSTSFGNFMHLATNGGIQAIITVNYGTGTSNEAAAWVLAANVTNHCGFKYWEIGNECYGGWETDSNGFPQDPFTYANRAAGYIKLMKAADPTIKIGVVSTPGENTYSNIYSVNHPAYNGRTGQTNYGWTPVMLTTLKSLGVTPDFLIHHVYPEYDSDNDATLLQAASNWAPDAANLRQQIMDYIGSPGTNIELCCTENNSDAGAQGRQSTSLVNGLYLADSLAQLSKTEFNSLIWWDLRNGSDTSGDFNASLYGWRTNGDLGIIGGLNTRYPTFYADKLMHYFVQPGDTVLDAPSDYIMLSTYAVRKADGALALLTINKDRYATMPLQISLANFSPSVNAPIYFYGIPQDEATRTNAPAAMQDVAVTNLSGINTNYTVSIPPYSLTLYMFLPAQPHLQPLTLSKERFTVGLSGQRGAPYILQSTTNLPGVWISVATNTLTGNPITLTNLISGGPHFWRAIWLP
jgi:hypothetical protein